MFLRYKTKIKPTPEQEILLMTHINHNRWVYNHGLALKKRYYRIYKKNLTWQAMCKHFTKIKKRNRKWLNEITAQSIQQELLHLDKAYKAFFRKQNRYPRFKRRNYSGRYSFPQRLEICDSKHLRIPKVGKIKSGEIDTSLTPKTTTIRRDGTGVFYISFVYEINEVEPPKEIDQDKVIGIDLGVKHFLVTDSGEKIENPKFLAKTEKGIKKAQQNLSRKEKNSKNREKERLKLAKKFKKYRNKKNDWQHKQSKRIVDESQAIIAEDLSVKQMMKNRRMSKVIFDASWDACIGKIKYKCRLYGKHFAQVDKYFPSTRLCSDCGHKNNDLKLKDRSWNCPSCGVWHDRDINAAINIKKKGLEDLMKTAESQVVDMPDGDLTRLQVTPDVIAAKVDEAGRTSEDVWLRGKPEDLLATAVS